MWPASAVRRLGHTRLAIIDLSGAGRQPMRGEQKRGRALVADHAAEEIGEDRCQGSQLGRYVTFQLGEVVVPRELFRKILDLIDDLRPRPAPV